MVKIEDFPKNVDEFMERHKVVKGENINIYCDGVEFIPLYRMKEWFQDNPQPRTGKWIRTYRDGFGNLIGHCNKCGRRYPVDNFCPNCGADMRDEQDG